MMGVDPLQDGSAKADLLQLRHGMIMEDWLVAVQRAPLT